MQRSRTDHYSYRIGKTSPRGNKPVSPFGAKRLFQNTINRRPCAVEVFFPAPDPVVVQHPLREIDHATNPSPSQYRNNSGDPFWHNRHFFLRNTPHSCPNSPTRASQPLPRSPLIRRPPSDRALPSPDAHGFPDPVPSASPPPLHASPRFIKLAIASLICLHRLCSRVSCFFPAVVSS
jgi:hypothetical protein